MQDTLQNVSRYSLNYRCALFYIHLPPHIHPQVRGFKVIVGEGGIDTHSCYNVVPSAADCIDEHCRALNRFDEVNVE